MVRAGAHLRQQQHHLMLHSFCPPPLVTLPSKADRGLYAFARVPEKESINSCWQLHSVLIVRLRLHKPPPPVRFVGDLSTVRYRGQDIGNADPQLRLSDEQLAHGIAHRLSFSLALEFESLEESLLVGLGLSWHWDYARMSNALSLLKS